MADPFAEATADISASMGVSAVYTPVVGAEMTIRVIRADNVEGVGEYGHIIHYGIVFDIDRADVDGPVNGDVIAVNGDTQEVFTVQEVIEQDEYMSKVAVRG